MMRRSLAPAFVGATVLIGIGLHAGCNDNALGPEKRRANQAPETLLTGGPPDSTYSTDHWVRLRWTGTDPDGAIDHYDFILVDHPAHEESIATRDLTADDRVVVRIPAQDDPRWTATNSTDSLFVTRADTLRDGRFDFERWHTFFVRAVDNEGRADPSPDYRSFNSHNIAPIVSLLSPVRRGPADFVGPTTIVFNWDGIDPLADGGSRQPVASRWALVGSNKDAAGVWRGLPDTLYSLAPSGWSPWHAWNARDGTGQSAVVRNLRTVDGSPGTGFYLFGVVAQDDGGAITPVFDWTSTEGKKNVTTLIVTGQGGPRLRVRDGFTVFNFSNAARPILVDIATGQTVHFRWEGDSSAYGGHIVGYRYGWDIQDPGSDEAWGQGWSETVTEAAPRVFLSGTHSFYLEARDNAELVTRARIDLTVQRLTRQRDLLLVDDTVLNEPNGEDKEERTWLAVIDSLHAERPFIFDRNRDVYDVVESSQVPPLSMLFDYKVIIWNIVGGGRARSGIRGMAYFYDPFDEGRDNPGNSNPLNVYLDNGGALWICGQQPTNELWPLPSLPSDEFNKRWPVNLTNWRLFDPQIAHPESIGTSSLLYRMGIEAVDLGSGGLALDRDSLRMGCVGLRRSGDASGGSRRFESDRVLDHSHTLVVEGADVEHPQPSGANYATSFQEGHVHAVHLSSAELAALGRGETVTVATATSSIPDPHGHVFVLVDRVGTWGAPLALQPDATWAYPRGVDNPHGVRHLVEIYNIPEFCANAVPRLAPPTDRVLPLYVFTADGRPDPMSGPFWPQTADGQPVLILAKHLASETRYSRAYCGFEPWRLQPASHRALARYILFRNMGLGGPTPP